MLNLQGETPTARGIDDTHQYFAIPFLRGTFGDAVLEPIAIVLSKGDVEYKKTVDRNLAALMLYGVFGRFYEKWFQQPIPPGNLRMDLPMTFALRDQLRWPTDRVGDEISK